MKAFELINLAAEAERYPALLAWFQQTQTHSGNTDNGYPVRWLSDEPESDCAEIPELFDLYVERGEIGAAQFLTRKYPELPPDRVLRRKSQLSQQLADALLNARDLLLQLKEANAKTAEQWSVWLDNIDADPVQMGFRPGWALARIQDITERLQEAVTQERERTIHDARDILASTRDNQDVETAVKRIGELISVPEGLATAAHLLAIAERAKSGTMSQDDMRLLYTAGGNRDRLVRPWSELRTLAADASGPVSLAERLNSVVFQSLSKY